MAKITWPSVGNEQKGNISALRTLLTTYLRIAELSKSGKAAILATLQAAVTALGATTPVQGASFPLQDVNGGAYGTTGVIQVDANGAITAIRLTATTRAIRSGVEFASPQVSGTWTDGYTPTIANGVVTGLAGS